MSTAEPQVFRNCVRALTRDGQHRVWSLIITIFGDLAQDPGERISGAVLSRILGEVGVKPEAMRVALHRLRKDGWIESRRAGRASLYQLSAHGRAQSAAASPRIYARKPAAPDMWHLLLAGSGDSAGARELEHRLVGGDYLQLASNALLGKGPPPRGCDGLFAIEGRTTSVPGWLREQICPEALCTAYRQLKEALEQVCEQLEGAPPLPPLQAATLRVLLVHSWRRVLLRHPDLPEEFFPKGWSGSACREMVNGLLDRLERPALDVLERESMTP